MAQMNSEDPFWRVLLPQVVLTHIGEHPGFGEAADGDKEQRASTRSTVPEHRLLHHGKSTPRMALCPRGYRPQTWWCKCPWRGITQNIVD